MNMNSLLAFILACVLVACGQKTEAPVPVAAPVDTPAPALPPTDDPNVATAKRAVLAVLKDPSSAQFEDVKGGEVNGDPTVCGKVNAKNAMGGYVGFKRFCWTGKNGLMPFSGE
jgi:hypothetical protein